MFKYHQNHTLFNQNLKLEECAAGLGSETSDHTQLQNVHASVSHLFTIHTKHIWTCLVKMKTLEIIIEETANVITITILADEYDSQGFCISSEDDVEPDEFCGRSGEIALELPTCSFKKLSSPCSGELGCDFNALSKSLALLESIINLFSFCS